MKDNNEFLQDDANALRDYYEGAVPADGMEKRTLGALKQKGAFKGLYARLTFAAVIMAAVFFTGYLMAAKPAAATAQNNKNEYLMLLYEPANFLSSQASVKEYADWYYSAQKKYDMLAGEELKQDGWNIAMQQSKPLVNTLHANSDAPTGYFIFYASSEKEALNIASTCPHLKYNGTVEVRAIEKH